jgi:hypothetical protein
MLQAFVNKPQEAKAKLSCKAEHQLQCQEETSNNKKTHSEPQFRA